MVYESTINFTLDTICPWTYIAKRRLSRALAQVRETQQQPPTVVFTIHYHPYQLHPEAPGPDQAQGKYEWYKREKYNGSEEQMQKYVKVMTALGREEGIDFNFGGEISNTLGAHRVIQYFQERKGEEAADKMVDSLYTSYFTHNLPPSSPQTLLTATRAADIPDAEAEPVINDPSEYLQDVKMQIQEQKMNGVDAVPYVAVEGKRRDFTLEGAKEVAEYVKTLEQVIKESS